MDSLMTFGLVAVKTLVLLAAAAGMALVLRGRPARPRAIIWAAALTGSLLIPVLTPLLPRLSVPVDVPGLRAPGASTSTALREQARSPLQPSAVSRAPVMAPLGGDGDTVGWPSCLPAIWVLGAALLAGAVAVELWRIAACVRRARPLNDPQWLGLLAQARLRTGIRRTVRLVISDELEVPATVGVLRPVVMVPRHARSWTLGRRRAVLLHELVHVARLDWPVRTIARLARAAYWFNPLAWLAVRRLELDQELACDEEVVAMGTRPSSYACHLLGIARGTLVETTPAISGLAMARRSHLEERIMTILDDSRRGRAGLTVLLPAAVVMAALVPALAAVDPSPRTAGPELRQVVSEMRAVESKLAPHLEKIEKIELEIEPRVEVIERIEAHIDEHSLAAIEARMKPHLERIEDIEIEMEPYRAEIERIEASLDGLELHIENGRIEDIQRQIHQQVQPLMEKIKEIHLTLEPLHQKLAEIHREMEPLHREIERIHIDMEPVHREMERLHEQMEPFHDRMEAIQSDMEPLHEEMERMHDRLDDAVRGEVAAVLRGHLGAVTAPDAPFDEAAGRILEEANVRIRDDELRVVASRDEVDEILSDLLTASRVGTPQAFDAAVDAAADRLSPLRIRID